MSLTIEHRATGPDSAAITLSGRLLLGPGCERLEQLLAQEMARGVRHFTFNLAAVSQVDSTGMGRFIDAYSKLLPLSGTVRIEGARGPVREMFRVTKLDTFLIFDDPGRPGQGG
jgi:anti-sigma B factor antagonist